MSESLGLSLGVANLVAARAGSAPVTRSAVLTLFDTRPSEVGLPEENPNLTEPGLVMRGFVERVGDRAPLVAADGTKYSADALAVEALEAMARSVGYGSPIAIAVPAYWSEAQSTALRNEFFAQPGLARDGRPPVLISDAAAALAALRSQPGFPDEGVVALCDFGAGGTSVTLANAGSNLAQIGQTLRYTDFSGEAIDQLVAEYVRSGGQDAATRANLAPTARTAAPGRLLDESRRAKEHLSSAPVTTLSTGSATDFRLSRTELEQLISGPLDGLLATIEETLQRNGITRANLAAVAIVGGGAGIPLVTSRLTERLQSPALTAPEPMLSAAIGAAVLGPQQPSAGAATAVGPAAETPTELVGTSATAAWPTQALAWSQDAATGQEPVPYTGPEHTGGYGVEATEHPDAAPETQQPAEPGPLPWYKRTALVLSVAAAGAAVLLAVVLWLTVGHGKNKPATPNGPAPPRTSQTVMTTSPNGVVTPTVLPPPPLSSTQSPASTTSSPSPSTTSTTTTTSSSSPATTTTTTSQQTSTTASSTTSQQTSTASPTRPFPSPRF